MENSFRILALGDIIGKPGRMIFQRHIEELRRKYSIDMVMVNGENSSHGRGINTKIVDFFKEEGVDVITSGNHIWAHKDVYRILNEGKYLLRPANYPPECPGKGYTIIEKKGISVAVISLQGRVFMHDHIDCPLRTLNSLLTFLRTKTNMIVIDFHAEATAEKMALAFYVDGKVSAIFGTHTHIQTADERILPGGTAYISDLGMAGAFNSMIGMKKGAIIQNFLTQIPTRFEVDENPPFILSGAWVEIDITTGKAVHIERINIRENC